MANRPPNVSYTLQTVSANTLISASHFVNLCNIIAQNFQEKRGIEVVWNNPEMYNNRATRLQYPANATEVNAMNTALNLRGNFVANRRISINDINTLISSSKVLQDSVKSLFTSNNYVNLANKNVNEIIKVSNINEIVQNLNIISNNFDSVNYFWDSSNDLCVRSCQTACQGGCQVACQSCYSSTCHNQNCGGWS